MGYVMLATVSLAAVMVTLCPADPRVLQGLPHGVSGIGSSFHRNSIGGGSNFPGSGVHTVLEPHGGGQSFQGGRDSVGFPTGAFQVGVDDGSFNFGQDFNRNAVGGGSNFPGSVGPHTVLEPHDGGQSFQGGRDFVGFPTGAFQVGVNDGSFNFGQDFNQGFQGGISSPIILGQPSQGSRSQGDGTGAFLFGQGDQQVFQGVQGAFQTGQNIFVDNNVFGDGQQQFSSNVPVTVTSTVDRYITTTDVAFNSLPVTFTNFNKRVVTRTTHQVLPTPVNDVVHVTTAVVRSTSTLSVTHVNTIIDFVTQTTVEVYPITHTIYNILLSTYTSVVTQRFAISSTIVHTNILTDTITVTDRRYITDYHYVTANYY